MSFMASGITPSSPDSQSCKAYFVPSPKRISPALIPEQRLDPGFDVVPTLSTRHQWFPCGRLSDPHLTRSRRAFSLTLTTGALDPSRSRWFGACLRRPTPRGLPSSRTHIAWRTIVSVACQPKTSAAHLAVKRSQQDVTQQGGNDPALRCTLLGREALALGQDAGLEHALDQPEHSPVRDSLSYERQ